MVKSQKELCLFLTAVNVFVGTATLTELISFFFPAALSTWQRRDLKFLPKISLFNLGKSGWPLNRIVVGWTAWTACGLVIFSFPIAWSVTAGSMSESRKLAATTLD